MTERDVRLADGIEEAIPATVPDGQAPEALASSAPRTKSGTQISSLVPDSAGALAEELVPSERRARSGSGFEAERPSASRRALEERLRGIEHRLDQLEARMRLFEKGVAPGGRVNVTSALGWGAVLVAVLVWALLSRI